MLLKGATVATFEPALVEAVDLRVRGERIVERGPNLLERAGEDVVDVTGRVIVPGLVNAHTHLYSALARGMPSPRTPPSNFVEVLEKVWWRLDRALDAEAVRLSAQVGGIEAALSGTTLLVDHHSSPSFVRGSLSVVRDALEEIGLRSSLCYEVTDRNGSENRDLGLEENAAFARHGSTALTRGLIGAHASFTLADETLARLASTVRETRAGLHVHVAEDRCDVEDCRKRYDTSLVTRFERYDLLAPGALFAHCVHLEEPELLHAQSRGAWIATNPRSNMNNHVGHAPTGALRRAALGTDGIDEDMFAEARAAFLKMRDVGRPDAFSAAFALLAGGHRLAAALFGVPFGSLAPETPADLVVLDYRPPTPLRGENLAGHVLFGMDRSHVGSVMVAGRFVVRERRVMNVDAPRIFAAAREAARALWQRMELL
jgi:putative selenium metabolism protein SsnA